MEEGESNSSSNRTGQMATQPSLPLTTIKEAPTTTRSKCDGIEKLGKSTLKLSSKGHQPSRLMAFFLAEEVIIGARLGVLYRLGFGGPALRCPRMTRNNELVGVSTGLVSISRAPDIEMRF
jgi:hypothetical protein